PAFEPPPGVRLVSHEKFTPEAGLAGYPEEYRDWRIPPPLNTAALRLGDHQPQGEPPHEGDR
ncbi:MAG: hypothetical protein ACUVWX_15195, partial [Kiritimatiellia bacterium]